MENEELIELLGDDSEALLADGYDDAIIGVAERINLGPVVAYDVEKIIGILIDEGLTYEEAVEHFEYNIKGAWMGEGTPIFITKLTE